ncbi:alpha/beta hydrolase-fold protein [Egicoccus sp. AB-alg2]|uniref:alpha/beta hydrolase-fold protein n=1 Tax=Egicoccus sp. AB-alg2 TaxID=3242693 RepID=UPI00359CFF25
MLHVGAQPLAIDQLRHGGADAAAVDRFLDAHDVPLVEGATGTFLWRGEADAVRVQHWVVGLPNPLPMERLDGTDLWFAVTDLPEGSRVEYRLEVVHGDHVDNVEDPRNPNHAHNPYGSNSVVHGTGYEVPDWIELDEDARRGELRDLVLHSAALGRSVHAKVYLPARYRPTARYPLLVVHDGTDYLTFAAAQTVLDNLIHRLDVAELVAVFLDPGDRLVEYANHEGHARFVADELVPELERALPLIDHRGGRCLMGSSFGAIAAFSTAVRYPDRFGSLLLQSGSFAFTDIGSDHGGGPVFDPVVAFVNAYRAEPTRVADRLYVTCGTYEPMIRGSRAMVPVFRGTGAEVRYVEARDGHNWENWRDRLRDGLAWVFPGPQKFVYE